MVRKAEYRLYPNKGQIKSLEHTCEINRQVYNHFLAQRIWYYQEWGVSLSEFQQSVYLTFVKKDKSEWQTVYSHTLQVTLHRLNLAFQSFFRKIKNGENNGFPRFKSKNRFSGFGFKEYNSGWSIDRNVINFSKIGAIKMRGKISFSGTPKVCEVIKKAGKWYVSISYEVIDQKVRQKGMEISGLDWGISKLATLANKDGSFTEIENPKHLSKSLELLKLRSAQFSRSKKKSKRREVNKLKLCNLHNKITNQRKDYFHKATSWLVYTRQAIAIEKLTIFKMLENNISKSLNREILSASAGLFHSMLKYKAEEAGVLIMEVDPIIHKPSQTCSVTGEIRKKELNNRSHILPDGTDLGRDKNSARNLLKFACKGLGTSLILDDGNIKNESTIEETESIPRG